MKIELRTLVIAIIIGVALDILTTFISVNIMGDGELNPSFPHPGIFFFTSSLILLFVSVWFLHLAKYFHFERANEFKAKDLFFKSLSPNIRYYLKTTEGRSILGFWLAICGLLFGVMKAWAGINNLSNMIFGLGWVDILYVEAQFWHFWLANAVNISVSLVLCFFFVRRLHKIG